MNPPAQPRQPPPHAAQPGGTPVDTTGSHTPEPVDLSAESVAGYEMYVTYFAKKREAQGKLRLTWPLSPADLARVTEAIRGGSPQAMRLFCHTCAERILASPRIQESPC